MRLTPHRELYWWAMKIALIGMPQVGKKTLFSLMTGMAYEQLTNRSTELPSAWSK